jgi:hypothetical protein
MVLVVAIVYPMVFFTRGSVDNISRTVRGIIALILAAALLALVAHMLSLIGWVLIPAAVIALAVGTGAMAVLGADTGTSRVARWGYWITLVLSWLIAVAGVALSGVGELPSSYLEVSALPQGTYVAMTLGVLALAAVDPLLRQSVASSESGFPVGALVMGVALTAGVIFAPLLMFGGSFVVPSVPFFVSFGFMPAGAIGVALALASLAVVTLIPCYIAVAGKMLAEVARLDGANKQDDNETNGATPGSMIMAALVAGSLAIALTAPSILVVVASLLAAAAGGAALSGIRPGLHVLASLLGAVVGAIPAAVTGGTEFFGWSWATAIGLVVAAVAGCVTAAVLGRARSPKTPSKTVSEVDHPVI